MHIVFHCRRHRLVHHLEPGRDDACGDDRRHCVTGLADVVKTGHDTARQLRPGDQFDRDLSATASIPSEPMTMLIKSKPGLSSASEPNTTASPSIVKPLILTMLCNVSPYFRQCTPPE